MSRPNLVEAVLQQLRQDQLTNGGGAVVVAVSGGADSSSLLDALARARGALDLHLTVAHFDHATRASSARDALAVARLAAGLGLPFVTTRHGGVPLRSEAQLREARHAFLDSVASNVEAATVAYGHTADDQVETLLLNMLRGAGLEGLGAMAVREGRRFRPLLGTWRSEVDEHCARAGLKPLRDATNGERRFRRNRVRLDLVPTLATYNPRIKEALHRLSLAAREEHAVVETLATSWLAAGNAGPRHDRDSFRALAPAVRVAVLRELWARASESPAPVGGAARLRQAMAWVEGPRRTASRALGGGVTLELRPDYFEFANDQPGAIRDWIS